MRALALALALAAAGSTAAATPTQDVFGTFGPYAAGAKAVTYNESRVPSGGVAGVLSLGVGASTTVVLFVHKLQANAHFGAHVHVKACGPAPADSGPHFQNTPDPVQPSVDPAYANPRNEVWLDFRTDDAGTAFVTATVPWRFTGRPAASVVIHEHHTSTKPGESGTAGARLACVNSTFK